MVGIPPKETDKILVEIMTNRALLDSCNKPHDFSICLDRHTKQAIESPTPAQRFGAKWKCSKCCGIVDSLTKIHYNEGLSDATADLQAQVEQLTKDNHLMKEQVRVSDQAFDFHLKRANESTRQVGQLRGALEKCVVALESEPFHSWRVKEAINTAKPLLCKP